MRYLGTLMVVLGIASVIVLADSAPAFIDIPGLIFVVVVGFGILFAAHGRSLLGAPDSPSGKGGFEPAVAETGMKAFIAAGWLGVLIGVIQLLAALDDPAQLGQATALALLTAFYGYGIAYTVFLPLSRRAAC